LPLPFGVLLSDLREFGWIAFLGLDVSFDLASGEIGVTGPPPSLPSEDHPSSLSAANLSASATLLKMVSSELLGLL